MHDGRIMIMTLKKWLRLVVLPIGFFGVGVFALALKMWAVAAIAAIVLAYFLVIVRARYLRIERREGEALLEQLHEDETTWSRIGVGLVASAASIVIIALAFGLTIGVLVAIVIWVILFGLWLIAIFKRSRTSRG